MNGKGVSIALLFGVNGICRRKDKMTSKFLLHEEAYLRQLGQLVRLLRED